jgi:ACS family glucarate transporter-like MFS transporter
MAAAPTRARHITLLFVVLLALITYMDRVAISVAAADIRKDLGLSLVQMGWALSVFGWAYAVFEIPGGWLGDPRWWRC